MPTLNKQQKRRTISQKETHHKSQNNRYSSLLPQIGSKRSLTLLNKKSNFNKYYITPSLRYKPIPENPRETNNPYEDETFLYQNLHNQKYWNWIHPLAESQIKFPMKKVQNQISRPVLTSFKNYIQQRTKKRVPIIVNDSFLICGLANRLERISGCFFDVFYMDVGNSIMYIIVFGLFLAYLLLDIS